MRAGNFFHLRRLSAAFSVLQGAEGEELRGGRSPQDSNECNGDNASRSSAPAALRTRRMSTRPNIAVDDEEVASAAAREVAIYCREHPRSPAATRRPRLMLRGNVWIALIGSTLEEGIAGMGGTVRAALRAFDARYAIMRPSVRRSA